MHLQYILELDLCGYSLPLVPRTDLSDVEKIDMLRKHRGNWRQAQLGVPSFIEVNWSDSPKLLGGIYAYTSSEYSDNTESTINQKIHFCELPSVNRGTTLRQWHHDISNYEDVTFAFHPDQDILLMMEALAYRDIPSGQGELRNQHVRVHLRTMSSNEPHPAASSTTLELHFTVATEQVGTSGIEAKIYGRLVAIIFASSTAMIYDWTTGIELMSLDHIDCVFQYYLNFLSEDYILVVQSLSASTNSKLLGTPEGLSVYHLLHDARTGSAKPRPVARLLLPDQNLLPKKDLPKEQPRAWVTMGDSILGLVPSSYWLSPSTGFPAAKIFELSRSEYTIQLGIDRQRADAVSDLDLDSVTLFVSSKALLNAVIERQGSETTLISWETWSHCAAWRELQRMESFAMCGQRAVTFNKTNPPMLSLYDFAQGPHEKSDLLLEANELSQAFADATRPYSKRDIGSDVLDPARHERMGYDLDHEHLVFTQGAMIKRDKKEKKGIWVYTF